MKFFRILLTGILFLVFVLFFIRLVLPSQVDDVNPFMNCSEEILDRADVYFVVPEFGNVSVLEVDGWCEDILGRDKELALHGVYHAYREFGVYRDEEYLEEGSLIFENCFGHSPDRFKPPQLEWTRENDWIKEEMDVEGFWNQLFHKVYHCGDSGVFSNWFIRVF